MGAPEISGQIWRTIELFIPPEPVPRKRRPGRSPGRKKINRRKVFEVTAHAIVNNILWADIRSKDYGCSGVTCWRLIRDLKNTPVKNQAGISAWDKVVKILREIYPDPNIVWNRETRGESDYPWIN